MFKGHFVLLRKISYEGIQFQLYQIWFVGLSARFWKLNECKGINFPGFFGKIEHNRRLIYQELTDCETRSKSQSAIDLNSKCNVYVHVTFTRQSTIIHSSDVSRSKKTMHFGPKYQKLELFLQTHNIGNNALLPTSYRRSY